MLPIYLPIMADHADDGDDDVFVYMGGRQEVPRDVTHIRVHKSVKNITEGHSVIIVDGWC